MARTGDTLTMPDGTSFLIARSAADSAGERVEFEITLPPGAPSPPKHFHPRQQEEWRVLEGALSVCVGDDWRTLRAGESVSIPPGTAHTLRNRSGEQVRVLDVHVPAFDFQEYMERLHELATAGKITSPRRPSTLFHYAMLWREQETQVAASPLQRVGLALLARLGRLLGYRIS
jgi:quercetin dioxygenase-like cupin family protein